MAKKIIISILSVILVGALAFLIAWGVINFNKVKKGLEGTALYTKEDVDAAYRDGYDTAQFDKSTIENQISELRVELTEKQAQLDELVILSERLTAENTELKETIVTLEKDIENLNKSISAYEEFIKENETPDTVVATFIFDGAVYKIQSYNPGETISIENPADTEDFIFLGWTLNNEVIDINNYVINESTTFEASFKRTYTIEFIADGTTVYTQSGNAGETLNIPEDPVKEGYIFNGWASDGQNVETIPSTALSSKTYYAVYELIEIEVKVLSIVDNMFVLEGIKAEVISGLEYIEKDMYLWYNGIKGTVYGVAHKTTILGRYYWEIIVDFGNLDNDEEEMFETLINSQETITLHLTDI